MKKELEKIAMIEDATRPARNEFFLPGMALLFIVGIVLTLISREGEVSFMLFIAVTIGGYMLIYIGSATEERDC